MKIEEEKSMYKVIIECEMSENDYANRDNIAKEISGGKIEKFDTLLRPEDSDRLIRQSHPLQHIPNSTSQFS